MSELRLSRHAAARISDRLGDIITLREVAQGVTGCRFYTGETWVKVKSLPSQVTLPDGCNGDTIYVIVKRRDNEVGTIATVELRRGRQRIKGDHYIDRT